MGDGGGIPLSVLDELQFDPVVKFCPQKSAFETFAEH